MENIRLIIGISGASGVLYGIRLLEALQDIGSVESHLVLSEGGKVNIGLETEWAVPEVMALADHVHDSRNLAASIASGSFLTAGMLIVPCSMKTLSSVVHSYADNLLTRAADVVLKEGRRLVLVPRETPLHQGHCKLLYEASMLGAQIVPPMPALYNKPTSVDDIINHTVGRLLDLFGIENTLVQRWAGVPSDDEINRNP